MNRQIIAQDIADHLGEAEMALTLSMAKTAKLLEAMVIAQGQMNLSHVMVEPAMRRVTNTLSTIGQAHSELIAAHNRLDQLQRRLGLEPVASGGMEKEDDGTVTPPHGSLAPLTTAPERAPARL